MAFAFPQEKKKFKVYLIGDSTMAIKDPKAYPETGWGMPFVYFFDSSVEVDNRAKNGRSTKTFIAEGLWQPVADNLKEGDYVLIQFGHNDEVKTKKSYSTEEEFQANLKRYVTETRRKKAVPILLTPVARRKFNESGKVEGTHEVYAELVRKVAKTEKVPLIDMDGKSQALLQQFGPETSKLLFLQLAPGEHPNYPEGKDDNTHFNELGARLMAQLVYAELKNLNLELASRFVKKESSK
ncbi:rhamnogalacturonan acetylesterase RhgT [Adhaeribacter aerolatus]|uniref:Rhamnogalacturonan acetylesterase RhgT n=2 Tax=Adhaeribacter aerolatus TaxID=670289 RepID=A0A512B2A3_9BACT|nr:rhamnogalacturonan acetylesterase RhgT [Adhaeribacter aerolatus]